MVAGTSNLADLAAKIGAPQTVVAAIQHASQRTGVDFNYLLAKAKTESSFNPDAKAKTSSATGLYQFTDKTWLEMVRQHGSECGIGQYADAINGDCKVSDSATRTQILNLRKDPSISAYMAAQFTKSNQETLEANTDGRVGKTELYLAHFLGAGGATSFLNAFEKNPNQSAANIVPEAAAANENVFYSKNGSALSLKQIYDRFASKFNETSPAFNLVPAQNLPTSPVLAAHALSNPSASANGVDAIAQIANINIYPAGTICNACSNGIATMGDVTDAGLSAAAMQSVQQQATQQQLAYLTQVALEAMHHAASGMMTGANPNPQTL